MAKRTKATGLKSAKAAKKPKKTQKPVCFVIMPFGGWFDDYYDSVYCPAISAAGLEPHRADDLYRPSTIVQDIWAYTKQAQLVLADLTGKNPNVFYELGLAHGIAKPVILVSESLDDIPFDLRALRVIPYSKNAPNWGDLLKDKIETAIREVLESPREAVLPAFLSIKGRPAKTSVTPQEKELLEVRKDLDLLKSELQQRRALEFHRRGLTADEAETRLRNYVSMGMPPPLILDRMVAAGAPLTWVQGQLGILGALESRSLVQPAPTAAPAESVEAKDKPKEGDKK